MVPVFTNHSNDHVYLLCMAIQSISIETFLELRKSFPVLDVRSPGEFAHAHFPNANNLPLFSDEERKIVGTIYKQESREKAIKSGLQFFGPKMVQMVETVEAVTSSAKNNPGEGKKKTVLVHCWRGGMRSAGVAWLLDLYGFQVYTLKGGYKVFRRWVLDQFEKEYSFCVVGGFTGSGKTDLLSELKSRDEVVVDLEAIACHKGSAFGKLEDGKQPSQEMFENKLALALCEASKMQKQIWIEDESQRIGDVNVPAKIYLGKQSSPVYFIDIPFEERLGYLLKNYGKADTEKLLNAVMRIKKRLGPLETKMVVQYLLEDDIRSAFAILLKYYDKWYAKSLIQLRDNPTDLITKISCGAVHAHNNANLILSEVKKLITQ